MSIGELTNLYKNGELIIRPEFQRFFRWSNIQKSRLVESILLGIPLPSIFVAQNPNGIWELVDGLQRMSTILQLQGDLLAQNGIKADPLILSGTKYLPALEGKRWDSGEEQSSLSQAQRLDFKRSRIDLKIIKRESSPQAKFDLFQRLNSYGAQANSQEMRSALIVSVAPDFLTWLESLASYPSFKDCARLSERLVDERYDLELVTRFCFLHNLPEEKLTNSNLRDLPGLLDEWSIACAERYPHGDPEMDRVFKSTFDFISANGSEKILQRFDFRRLEFRSPFLNTSFEVFALGVGYNIANGRAIVPDLTQTALEFWSKIESGFATGRSTEARLVEFVPIGRTITSEGVDALAW